MERVEQQHYSICAVRVRSSHYLTLRNKPNDQRDSILTLTRVTTPAMPTVASLQIDLAIEATGLSTVFTIFRNDKAHCLDCPRSIYSLPLYIHTYYLSSQ
jgi:hypothetical protein